MTSQDYQTFRTDVRDWLTAHLTDELRTASRLSTSVFIEKRHNLKWQAILHTRGWVAPHWPAEYGGPGWDDVQRHIFASECATAGAPALSPMGLRMVAPCIMKFGTPEQIAHYLPRLLNGDDYWCQGYSEPQAGSDLAALSLSAKRDGDHYVLNGSKIWTTHAHFASKMFCLVRTSRDARPQSGITFLLLDMETPGISVRPILTLSGDHDFNQVFFDDARVPVSGRLGDDDAGWGVAKYLLEFERAVAYAALLKAALTEVRSGTHDPAILRKANHIDVEIKAIEAVEQSVMIRLAQGHNPGPASSMLKVQGTECQQRIQELALEAAGDYAAVHQIAARQVGSRIEPVGPMSALTASACYFNGRAASIYGGSNEIQRGIMAKMVLGL